MCGLGPYHIRILCNNTFDGGMGYTPEQVGDMTLDQVFMLLCDKKILRANTRHRIATVGSEMVPRRKDGKIRAVDRNGKPLNGIIAGQSRAQQLWEQQKKAEAENVRRNGTSSRLGPRRR